MQTTTVIIVGGGPAGAACAWQLVRHNIPCLILDKAVFPRAKPCAGWITPEVFQYLELLPGEYPHGLTTFTSFEISLRGLKFRLPTRQYAIRRIEFDAWLLERSSAKVQQHQMRNIEIKAGNFVVDDQFSARFIVGAGGMHCPVRRALFTMGTPTRRDGLIVTKEEEFTYPYHDDRCYLWFFEGGLPGYAWYVPKSDGYLNVGIGGSAARLQAKGQTLNEYWSRLVDKLDRSGLVNGYDFQPQGYSYYLRGRALQIRQGNAFLVGDALGLATRDMGEGIGAAIHSGLLAADAIIHQRPYEISAIPRYSLPSLLRLRRSTA
jgi:flavin-dependent dehydrogenase